MRLGFGRNSKRGLTTLLLVAAATVTSLFWAWGVNSAQNPQLSAAGVVASRFPAEWSTQSAKPPAALVLARAHPSEPAAEPGELDFLSPVLRLDQADRDPPAEALALAAPALPDPNAARVSRPASRSANLLNDAQIASIRDRLKLSSDQQQLWPAVETALRAVVWRGRDKAATLDPAGVEKLKTALVPLVKKLRAEQKEELRLIAHLMGLEKLASYL
jgi:hypothetical protein